MPSKRRPMTPEEWAAREEYVRRAALEGVRTSGDVGPQIAASSRHKMQRDAAKQAMGLPDPMAPPSEWGPALPLDVPSPPQPGLSDYVQELLRLLGVARTRE